MRNNVNINDLRDMFAWGVRKIKTHMIILVDRSENEEEIVYASGSDDLKNKLSEFQDHGLVSVVEVYNLAADMEAQISQDYTFNI